MNYLEILGLIVVHWFADFVLQTDEEAKNKSTSMEYLLDHTLTYSFFMWLYTVFIFGLPEAYVFALVTLVAHTTTDYFTSRLNSKLWKEGKVHNFLLV